MHFTSARAQTSTCPLPSRPSAWWLPRRGRDTCRGANVPCHSWQSSTRVRVRERHVPQTEPSASPGRPPERENGLEGRSGVQEMAIDHWASPKWFSVAGWEHSKVFSSSDLCISFYFYWCKVQQRKFISTNDCNYPQFLTNCDSGSFVRPCACAPSTLCFSSH